MGTNDDWLALVTEETLEPDLPICDPHHHLWDFQLERVEPRYLIDELLNDTQSGHNIVSTVFIECGTMFREDGPEGMKPVGEVEFANGIAAMGASGLYGKTRVAAGIVGHADLMLGQAVGDVLDAQVAAGNGRFKGIRHMVTYDARSGGTQRAQHQPSRPLHGARLSGGPEGADAARPDLRRLVLSSATAGDGRPGARQPGSGHHHEPSGRPPWVWANSPAAATKFSRPGRRITPIWPPVRM